MSVPPRPVVCLLRTLEADDPYERALTEAGFTVVAQPVLQFTAVNQQALLVKLKRPDDYAGLLVTSPRAVQILAVCLDPEIGRAWKTKPAFVVGPRTAALLRDLGFRPQGEAAGDARTLAPLLTSQLWENPLLFPCGNRRRDVLPEALRAARVPFEECIVYETHLRRSLDLSTFAAADWLVFFSPSGVEAMQQAQGIDHAAVRHAALGPTTAEALEVAGWTVDAVADAPTPEALARALRQTI